MSHDGRVTQYFVLAEARVARLLAPFDISAANCPLQSLSANPYDERFINEEFLLATLNECENSTPSFEIGIKPSPLSFYCVAAKLKPAFVFGLAAWTRAQIHESFLGLHLHSGDRQDPNLLTSVAFGCPVERASFAQLKTSRD